MSVATAIPPCLCPGCGSAPGRLYEHTLLRTGLCVLPSPCWPRRCWVSARSSKPVWSCPRRRSACTGLRPREENVWVQHHRAHSNTALIS